MQYCWQQSAIGGASILSLNSQRSENPDYFELAQLDNDEDTRYMMDMMLMSKMSKMSKMMMLMGMWVKLAGRLSGASPAQDRGCTHHLLSPLALAHPLPSTSTST